MYVILDTQTPLHYANKSQLLVVQRMKMGVILYATNLLEALEIIDTAEKRQAIS